MNVSELLGGYGVTVDFARQWIFDHIETPKSIFDTAVSIGLTSDMLAEIVAPNVPGVTTSIVENFFNSHGLNGSALHAQTQSTGDQWLPDGLSALNSLVTLNTHTGVLSTQALRTIALYNVSDDNSYNSLFDPAKYAGSGDGTFTGEDLGIPGLASFAATAENLESLFFGTFINAMTHIDAGELTEMAEFMANNQAALQSGSAEAMTAMASLLVSVCSDSANPPILTDDMIASVFAKTFAEVELVGVTAPELLLQGLVSGAIG